MLDDELARYDAQPQVEIGECLRRVVHVHGPVGQLEAAAVGRGVERPRHADLTSEGAQRALGTRDQPHEALERGRRQREAQIGAGPIPEACELTAQIEQRALSALRPDPQCERRHLQLPRAQPKPRRLGRLQPCVAVADREAVQLQRARGQERGLQRQVLHGQRGVETCRSVAGRAIASAGERFDSATRSSPRKSTRPRTCFWLCRVIWKSSSAICPPNRLPVTWNTPPG